MADRRPASDDFEARVAALKAKQRSDNAEKWKHMPESKRCLKELHEAGLKSECGLPLWTPDCYARFEENGFVVQNGLPTRD